MSVIFKDQHFFYYFVFIVLLLIVFFLCFFWRKKNIKKWFEGRDFKKLFPSHSFLRKMISLGLSVFILIFIILSMARPQIPLEDVVQKNEGIDVMLIVDVSKSMLAKDVRPSRLALVKTQLSRWVQQSKKNHRMGLIVFAGSSFLLSPLTSDLQLIQLYLDSLSTDIVSSQGTNMRRALELALESFEKGALSASTKAVIIASDGEDHEVGALKQIRKISNKGIRIFSLGFGTKKGGAIPLGGGQYQKDRQGKIVISKFKGNLLKEYAKIGKGAFYHVQADLDFAGKLHQNLMDLDQHVFKKNITKARSEKYQYFLLIAFLFALIYWVFSERKHPSGPIS